MNTKDKKRAAAPGRRPAERTDAAGHRAASGGERPRADARQNAESTRRQPGSRPARDTEPRQIESSAEEVVFHPNRQPGQTPRDPQSARRAAQRRRSAQRARERKEQEKRRKHRPAVSYTQPRPFHLNTLLLQIAVVLAVVAAITMGLSVFFKVKNVVVYGNRAYGAWTVQEASGIEAGDRLLSLNNARACGKIKTALPYVDTVRIGIKLPDTVNIYIEEFDVAYAIQTGDGTWWLMTSQGKAVEQIDGGTAGSYTKVLGVTLDNPVEGEPVKAVITQDAPASTQTEEGVTVPAGETIPVTVTGTDRLNAALHILSCLENNDIVGEVASVDVSSLSNIELWYGQRFQVKLGDTGDMEKKITYMNRAISQLNDYEMGVLDVSFTTWPDQPGYTPFE